MKTKVIFRRWKKAPKTVIAVFPELPGTINPVTCSSYEHTGQHGSCDSGIAGWTAPAKPDEYLYLFNELKRIGYDLQIIKRMRYSHYLKRKEQL